MILHIHASNIDNVTTILHSHQSPPVPSTTSNNLNSDLATEDAQKPHHFQESINKLTNKSDTSPVQTKGCPCTTTSYSDVHFK